MSDHEFVSPVRRGGEPAPEPSAERAESGDRAPTLRGVASPVAVRPFEGATIMARGTDGPLPARARRATRAGGSTAPGASARQGLSLWDQPEGSSLTAATRDGADLGAELGAEGSSAPPLEPGMRVQQYELVAKLGEGGMGTVFLARDLRLGREVAIKFLRTAQPELMQRFLVEARATARCQHENIVVIYEVGEHVRAPYIVLEYLSGRTLTTLIQRGQRLPYARAVEIMIAILRALQCAHAQGVVHRDLKPDNVFLTDAGGVKVLDFGIAKVMPPRGAAEREPTAQPTASSHPAVGSAKLTQAGTIMGTMQYMAPEQWCLGAEIDPLADLWACGVLLYRMICGRHPLAPLEGKQLIATSILELPMPSLAAMAPAEVPRELVSVVDRCLRKDKAERWRSAAELRAALEALSVGRRTSAEALSGRRAAEALSTGPYVGLVPFSERDAGRFRGRALEVSALVRRLRERPLAAVVGASGVGKSSLLLAGVAPALQRSGEPWEVAVLRPGRAPLRALAALPSLRAELREQAPEQVPEQVRRWLVDKLRREPGALADALRGRAKRRAAKLLLVVDQLEDIYREGVDSAERAAFTSALAAAAVDASSPLRVVVSLRADFIERAAENPRLMNALTRGRVPLVEPSREELRAALVEPLEAAGYAFETSHLVDEILSHLEARPGALPLLQVVAVALWEARDRRRRLITEERYRAMGGVAGALVRRADRVIGDLAPHYSLCREILRRLVGGDGAPAAAPMSELLELSSERLEVRRLVEQMVAARLLVARAREDGEGSTVELAHPSLVSEWPILRRWRAEPLDEGAREGAWRGARAGEERPRAVGASSRADLGGACREALVFAEAEPAQ